MSKTETGSHIESQTIGDIVAADFRSAQVFEKHGIDFCCGGKTPFLEACREKDLNPSKLLAEIEEAGREPLGRNENYAAWSLSFLADYIINTHHAYLKGDTAQIAAYADKIASVHGAHHPEVIEIAGIFRKVATDMAAHLKEEEEVLFPAVRRIEEAAKSGRAAERSDVELIRESLLKLDAEHQEIGDAVHAIRDLAQHYAVPDDVCNTFMVTYKKLKEFEDDLHKHVHLENNILFPKAGKLA